MINRIASRGFVIGATVLLTSGALSVENVAESNAPITAASPNAPARGPMPKPPPSEHARLMFEGQEAMAQGRHDEAEALFHRVFEEARSHDPRAAGVAQRWWALSMMEQEPFPRERVEAFIASAASDGSLASADLWNAVLRLLLRQVAATAPAEREATWTGGLERLRSHADDKPLYTGTLEDLDRLLAVDETKRGIAAVKMLGDLMLATPSADALRELAHRHHDALAAAGRADEARYMGWLRAVLALATDGEAVVSVSAHVSDSAASVVHAAAPALPPAPPRPSGGMGLARQAQDVLTAADTRQARRRAWLASLAGDDARAVTYARQALEAAQASQVGRRLEDGAAIIAIALGRLDRVDALSHWYGSRFGLVEEPDLGGEVSTWLEAAEPIGTAGSFSMMPRSKQAEMVRRDLNRWAERYRSWAAESVANGNDASAAAFWALALGCDRNRMALDKLSEQIHSMKDRSRALSIVRAVRSGMDPSLLSQRLTFLEATLRYEAGQMDECLELLSQTDGAPRESLDEAERVSIGLMRAVAMVKLRRLDEAAQVLADVERLDGETEQMAQALFLHGWIHLNRNETGQALAHFRRLADEYPGSTYAGKVRELIRRLELAELNG